MRSDVSGPCVNERRQLAITGAPPPPAAAAAAAFTPQLINVQAGGCDKLESMERWPADRAARRDGARHRDDGRWERAGVGRAVGRGDTTTHAFTSLSLKQQSQQR